MGQLSLPQTNGGGLIFAVERMRSDLRPQTPAAALPAAVLEGSTSGAKSCNVSSEWKPGAWIGVLDLCHLGLV